MAKTTTASLFVKHPQWVVETTEGTTPTASPSFTSLGVVKSVGIKVGGGFIDIAQVGSEDLIAILQGLQEYETQFTLTVQNITGLLDRAFDAANFATPTGTTSETITIAFSIYLNGTQNYILCKGSRIKECTLTMEVGKETEVTVSFTHMTITAPFSTSDGGLTTPSWASLPTGAVWGHTDGGSAPISWNASGIDCKKFSITVNRNSKPDYTLGNIDPHSSQPHGRRISGDFTVLWTATTLEADFRAGTARTLTATIKTSTGVITVTGAKIVDYSRDGDIGSDEAIVENCTFRGLSCAIATS